MSTAAADEYAFIAQRLKEIRADRERHSGVKSGPLPEVPRNTIPRFEDESDEFLLANPR